MSDKPDQKDLLAFLATVQQALDYAQERVVDYSCKLQEALRADPQTASARLEADSSRRLGKMYAYQVKTLTTVVSDFREIFNEYLPQEADDGNR
jgi:hypothetical protein